MLTSLANLMMILDACLAHPQPPSRYARGSPYPTDTVQNKENANLDNINLDYMALCESFISLRRSEYYK